MQSKFKLLIIIFHFLLFHCSLEQGYVYSTKFFEPVAYKTPIPKKVCLLPLENKDMKLQSYLTEHTFNTFNVYGISDAEKDGTHFNPILNQSLLKYIRYKNIFQQIEFCENQLQDYRIKLVLEKYHRTIYYPIHPLISGMFMAGIPFFFTSYNHNIQIRIEIFRNSEKISEYLHVDEIESDAFEQQIPIGAYKYVETIQTRPGSSYEIYLDGIYDKLFEKIYLDAKSWK